MTETSFELVIGNKNWSTWSLRPWLLLSEYDFQFTEIHVPLRTEASRDEIGQYSPSGLVPLLKKEKLRIWDSLAIAEYLSDLEPEKQLWPSGRDARAIARSISCEMHSGFAALRDALPMVFAEENQYFEASASVLADISRVLAVWRQCRADFGSGGPFLFGAFSIADAMYAPVVSRFRSYDVDVDATASAYMDAVWSLPSMGKWLEGAQEELQSGRTPKSPNSR